MLGEVGAELLVDEWEESVDGAVGFFDADVEGVVGDGGAVGEGDDAAAEPDAAAEDAELVPMGEDGFHDALFGQDGVAIFGVHISPLLSPEYLQVAALVEHFRRQRAVLEVGMLGEEFVDVVAFGFELAAGEGGEVGAAVDVVVLVALGFDGDVDTLAAGVLLQPESGFILKTQQDKMSAAVVADGLQEVAGGRAGTA